MTNEIINLIVGVACATVSSFITFLMTKKKYGAEVESQQIKNLNEAFDTYKKTVETIYKTQTQRIESLEKENSYLKQQVNQLQNQLTELMMTKIHIKEGQTATEE